MLRSSLRWLLDKVAEKIQRITIRVLAAGPVPKHVAFIMDGNRRWARMHSMKVHQGHVDGYGTLRRMLEICFRLNVKCVSAYAFALENFKRPPEEVDALMKLAEEKLLELCTHGDLLHKYGVRLNIVGRIDLLPEAVQFAARKAEMMTRHNDKAIFNLCMPYGSRDEIVTAINSSISKRMKKLEAGDIFDFTSDVTEEDINAELMITKGNSPPLEILVRTSGVRRLSDYMLWQCCENTQIQFCSTYWPNFGFLNFLPIILDYQRKVWFREQEQGRIHSS